MSQVIVGLFCRYGFCLIISYGGERRLAIASFRKISNHPYWAFHVVSIMSEHKTLQVDSKPSTATPKTVKTECEDTHVEKHAEKPEGNTKHASAQSKPEITTVSSPRRGNEHVLFASV